MLMVGYIPWRAGFPDCIEPRKRRAAGRWRTLQSGSQPRLFVAWAPSGMTRRIRNNLQVAFRLLEGGVTLGSVLLYPLRRRRSRNPENRIKLKSGISISSPAAEELLHPFEEIWIEGRYAPDGLGIPPGATVVDVGANVGVFTLWAVKCNAARVIAVEPSPRMCEYLSRNVSLNHFGNVTVVQAACGGRTGEAVLYSRGDEVLNTLYCRDVLGSEFRPLCRMPVLTLEDIFSRYGVETCHLLKLDCEGAEYDILLNTREDTLRRIQTIAMEYHVGLNEHDPLELLSFLEAHGFKAEKTPLLDPEGGYLYATRHP